MSSSQPNKQHHSRIESNNIDPDDGNSRLCAACNLPIFATPFTGGGDGAALLHDTCSNLPEILSDCELHPQKPLFLGDNNNSAATCSECSQKCGTKFYYCRDSDCGVVLDVSCALPIKILHRSHRHRLVAVRGGADSSFLICGVCGVAHKEAAAGRSYFCNVCGFWIHPECATSANVIEHEKHVHPLVLYYDVVAAFGAQPSIHVDREGFFGHTIISGRQSLCAICKNDVVGTRFGIYSCIDCGDCILHINCATSDRRSFKPVLGREAGFKSLVRLPIPDEHHSIVSYVRDATNSSSSSSSDYYYTMEIMHNFTPGCGDHRLILQHHDDDHITKSDDRYDRVCDACLKIINTPDGDDPFYSCSTCPNFFLHDFCYRIPLLLTANPASQEPEHRFFFCLRDYFWSQSICSHCSCRYVRAFYFCYDLDSFKLDVPCALMPGVVTHEAHGTSHFLRLTKSSSRSRSRANCDCCSRSLDIKLAYECRTCPNFALHTWCAMLPKTVTHKFDPHPLRLITAATATKRRNISLGVSDICEICEHEIDDEVWYYGCERCEQSFHVDCIPCLDLLYKIKSLLSVGRMRGRGAPTRLIRGLTLQGHAHDYCGDVADEYDILAT